ncbi:MAG: hypothetical protein AAF485_16900 [Chloroflexota bacterium]
MKYLDNLTISDIQARCSDASYERGEQYYNLVEHRLRLPDGLEARVSGSSVYRITIHEAKQGLITMCSCPYNWGGDCKHIVATLLNWIRQPERFITTEDLKTALNKRKKADLVALLDDICRIYPHLVDEFGLLTSTADYDPELAIQQIFSDLEPPGEIDDAEALARMDAVARQADRLADQGQGEIAREAYYLLTLYCKDFCEEYGSGEIFPDSIPYDFAVAYQNLALQQLDNHTHIIEQEMRKLLSGDWAPEILGIEDAIHEVWKALGM